MLHCREGPWFFLELKVCGPVKVKNHCRQKQQAGVVGGVRSWHIMQTLKVTDGEDPVVSKD